MKKLSLKAKIDLSFCVVILLFISLLYATYYRARVVNTNRQIIRETFETNTILEKILSNTIDIETGVRGYTITGQPDFLKIYQSGGQDLQFWQDSLNSLKRETDSDQSYISRIDKLISHKKDFTEQTLTLAQKDRQAAAELVATGEGRLIMDSLRKEITLYQTEQEALLNRKLVETDFNVLARNTYFFLFAFITFCLILLGYFRIRVGANRIIADNILQQKLTDELSFQNRQLNDFANITSHNMRSSAANMTALISMVDEQSSAEEYAHIFGMLRKVSNNLNESLNELIEIIRVKRNTDVQKETVRFSDIYEKVTATLQGDILNHGALVSSDFSAAETVVFSKVYLESCLQNLIGNAIKYRSPDRIPEIRVYTETQGAQTLLHVQDNGLGIDLEKHGHKIFGMYQMFHNHPEAKGIGLFLTKAQIENAGGKISVTSDGKSGSTFTIAFGK